MFHEQIGVGVAHNRFWSRIDAYTSSFDGDLKFGYGGMQGYLTGTFWSARAHPRILRPEASPTR